MLVIERRPIGELEPDPDNARAHDRRNVEAIKASLERFGQRVPLVVREGRIVAGNATTTAARELGWTELDTTPADDLSEREARALAIALNRTPELATWDLPNLTAALHELAETDELAGTGFSDDELAELEAAVAPSLPGAGAGGADPDVVPELPPVPVTKLGDLWQLGPHLLVCGDAHEPAVVDRLLAAAAGPPVMVLTDPPYAIYGSSSGVSASVADDKMVRPFFAATWRAIARVLPVMGHAYLHCDWRSWATIWEQAHAAGITIRNMLVWDKGGFGLGSNYANNHELLMFAVRLPEQRTMTSSLPTGQRQVHKPNVLHFPRVGGDERQHNAAKPTALLQELIVNSSDRGALVLDLFGGSGSTLIAADQTGRRAAVCELDPGWCDVICRRYEQRTGAAPVLVESLEQGGLSDAVSG